MEEMKRSNAEGKQKKKATEGWKGGLCRGRKMERSGMKESRENKVDERERRENVLTEDIGTSKVFN